MYILYAVLKQSNTTCFQGRIIYLCFCSIVKQRALYNLNAAVKFAFDTSAITDQYKIFMNCFCPALI